MCYSSGNYEAFARPGKPQGVDNKTAPLGGAGLASMSAAALMIRDGQLPGAKITILERLSLPAGALDGIKEPKRRFIISGGREMGGCRGVRAYRDGHHQAVLGTATGQLPMSLDRRLFRHCGSGAVGTWTTVLTTVGSAATVPRAPSTPGRCRDATKSTRNAALKRQHDSRSTT